MAEAPAQGGELRRFLLAAHPVRGHHVRLGSAWRELRHGRAYPPAVMALLGESAVATVLLAATLKFSGKLTLQLKGNGLVPLLVTQCTHDFQLRGTATCSDDIIDGADFATLIGNGQLVVTIENGAAGRYQGIVPMQAGSIAACIDDYFLHSEQLPTRLRLQCDADGCNGLLLQRLPLTAADLDAASSVESVWQECVAALDALPSPLLSAATAELLPAVAGEHDCRLLDATAVVCRCSCSRERVSDVVRSLGAHEAHTILAEQGQVAITCEFCGRSWTFDAPAVERLFTAGLPPADAHRLN